MEEEVQSVAAAVERTADTGMARVSLETIPHGPWTPPIPKRQRPRRLPFRSLFGRAAEKGFTLLIGRLAGQVRRAEGFLDFSNRRCAIDYGAYAVLVDGSSQWDGRSGRSIATLDEQPAQAWSPLWLFDLLRGVTDASEVTAEPVRGRSCRCLRASVDLARVSAEVPGKTAVPPFVSLEDLQRLPVDVWLDDEGYVRRIRGEHRNMPFPTGAVESVELFELGTQESLDWSRLPLLVPVGAKRRGGVRFPLRRKA